MIGAGRGGGGALASILVFLIISCGRGEGESTPTATPAHPTPARTPAPAESPRPPTDACNEDLGGASTAVTVLGAEAGDFLADRFSLASGDFNGDGLDDLLIGAPLADGPDNNRENGGEAYVILGTAAPPSVIDLGDRGARLTVYPEGLGTNLGFTVAAGDVNGDGTDDILAGARFAGSGQRGTAGKAYVIFGGPDLPSTVDTAENEQDVTVAGVDGGDFLSVALASGDVDGDTVADILLGASGGAGPNNDMSAAGEVYVVLGSPELEGFIDLAEQPPFFTVYGAAEEDHLPNYVASGDLDSDGRHELLIGAPFADGAAAQEDAGRAYVVPVPEDGGSLELATGAGFTTVIGASQRDGLGFSLASGDVNGDGNEDAIIGARDADGPGDSRNNAGEVHLLLGGAERPAVIDLAEEEADAVIHGVDAGDSLGFSVATGDFNGDGIDDILMGSPLGNSCNNKRGGGGEAHLLFGRNDFPATTDLAESGSDTSFFGREAGDEAGFSVASGDFNGDSIDDALIGALLADGTDDMRPDGGEAYVVLGGER